MNSVSPMSVYVPNIFAPHTRRHLSCLFTLLFFSCVIQGVEAQETSAESKAPAATDAAATNSTASTDAGSGAQASTAPDASETPAKTKDDDAADDTDVAFKSRPYTVRIDVAIQRGCFDSFAAEERQLELIREAVARMYGRVWQADVQRSSFLIPPSRNHLAQLSEGELIDAFPETMSEKTFFVVIESVGSVIHIRCREYDARIRELTAIYEDSTMDSRSVASITAELLRDAFRPVAMFVRNVENEEGRDLMELQVQAGAISPPDPSAEQVVEDDVLRTFTRQMERRDPTAVKLLRAYPLSYVRVLELRREFDEVSMADREDSAEVVVPSFGEDEVVEIETPEDADAGVARGMIKGIFLTHMRVKLFGAKGRRMQHLAVRQRPRAESSRVRIVLQGRPDRPLVSHRLAIAYQLHWKDPENGPQTSLVTDRNGEVVVERRPKDPTFWIRVYSGRSLLARVPYAPGLIPYDVVELPNDSVRLAVEGEISLISDELIDAIAVREVLLARATAAAKESDQDTVKELLAAVEEVPGQTEFLDRINSVRIPAMNEAKERRLGTRGIKTLCDGLQSTVETFFSDQKRAALQQRIQQIKRDAGL